MPRPMTVFAPLSKSQRGGAAIWPQIARFSLGLRGKRVVDQAG
jgi:hypothetical protein